MRDLRPLHAGPCGSLMSRIGGVRCAVARIAALKVGGAPV